MKWLTAHHENTTDPNDNEPDTDNSPPPTNNNGDSQSIPDKDSLSNTVNPSAENPSALPKQKTNISKPSDSNTSNASRADGIPTATIPNTTQAAHSIENLEQRNSNQPSSPEVADQKQSSTSGNKTKTPPLTLSVRYFHLLILAAINVLVYLSHAGSITEWLRRISGGNHIDTVNLNYLTSARQYSSDLLGLLTESKMIISVLQSSQGGISFVLDVQVQIGQILTSLYDAINFTWKLTLGSLSSIELLSLILDVNHFSMTIALTIFFVLLGFSIGFRAHNLRASQLFCKLSATLGLIVLTTHFLIPYSIYGTATLSKYIFSNHKYEVYRGFSNLHTQLPRHDQNSDLKTQVKSTITHFKNNQSPLKKHSNNLSNLSAKHLTLSFVEYLFMPLLIFYLLVLLTKYMISFLFR